jgi:hypothetical protein
MTPLLIMLAAIVIGVLLGLLVTIPSIRKKEDAAIKVTKDALGASEVVMIEPRTTAMGFEPTSANGVKAMCCLTASATDLMAVSWSNRTEWRIARSAITKVDTEAPDRLGPEASSPTPPRGDEVSPVPAEGSVPWLTGSGTTGAPRSARARGRRRRRLTLRDPARPARPATSWNSGVRRSPRGAHALAASAVPLTSSWANASSSNGLAARLRTTG